MAVTRIACITDTHIGCDEKGFKRQPRYLERLDDLYEALRRWLAQTQPDLLVHAGDVTDHGNQAEIAEAIELFDSLDVPVAMCLGNHDLCEPESLAWWREAAGALIAGGDAEVMRVALKHGDVLLVTHHWRDDVPFHWAPDLPQQPRLDAQQHAALAEKLAASSRPTILVSHAPAHAIEPEQTGRSEPVHPPHPPYRACLETLARRYPHLRLVLSGHNHANCIHDNGAFVSCSTIAFNERPAALRMIELDDEAIRINTVSLAQTANLPAELEPTQAWGVGGTAHRQAVIPVTATRAAEASGAEPRQ